MEIFGNAVELLFAVFFVYLALHPRTRVGGAMPGKRKTGPPISRAGRVIFVLIATVLVIDGMRGLLHKPRLEFDIIHWRFVS